MNFVFDVRFGDQWEAIENPLEIRGCSNLWSTNHNSNIMEKLCNDPPDPFQTTSHIYEVANAISRSTTPIRPSRFLEDKKWPPHHLITTHHFRINSNNNNAHKNHFRPNIVNIQQQQQSNSLWNPKLTNFNHHDHLLPPPTTSPSPLFKLSRCGLEPDHLVQRPSTQVSLFNFRFFLSWDLYWGWDWNDF